MLLPVSMVIWHCVPPTLPSTTNPSPGLKEDPVLNTLGLEDGASKSLAGFCPANPATARFPSAAVSQVC